MIVCTFHGPNHFFPSHDESSIEVYENIGHAISALFDRYDAKGKRTLPVRYLNGGKWRVPFPHVELGDYFNCYRITATDPELQVIDALGAVHGGAWDYRLTLMRPFNAAGVAVDGTVSISVEKG